ncbi:MAG: arginine decarboxylase, pyruvoyl-dependent [Hyphomicrobiales bacterium]|nr:arginine decarboxylase, pyruvoyl-dependent [Hyphomicrobiales bacterium]
MTPTRIFLTRGIGRHRHQLAAFEFALRDAGIERQNLVFVSSVLPPNCAVVPRDEGTRSLSPGEITYCVMARAETDEPGRRIAASIGIARPTDSARYGYISEHHGHGLTERDSGDRAEDLAATMLASTLGISFNPDSAWDERKQLYVHSQLIIESSSITAATDGDPDGRWTCALAAAVLLP